MELSIKVDLKGIEKMAKRWPEAVREARVSRITEALLLLEPEVKKEAPVGAGPIHLRDTIFHRVNYGEPIWGLIGTPAIHAEAVEMGTRPHFPPVDPIQHWVERVIGVTGKEARTVAFLIARAISKRGTKPRRVFETAFNSNRARVERILQQIPADVVNKVDGR